MTEKEMQEEVEINVQKQRPDALNYVPDEEKQEKKDYEEMFIDCE